MKSESPLISIIIPVHNVEAYLSECLDSVIGQSHSNIEILCIDDASADGSLTILKKYQKKDKRIIVFNNETKQGPSYSRNIGLKNAKGEFFTFVDSDDIIHPEYCKVLLNAIGSDDICVSFLYCFKESETPKLKKIKLSEIETHSIIGNPIRSLLYGEFASSIAPKLYRKSIINVSFYEKCDIGEDLLYISEAVTKSNKKITLAKEYIYFYRVRTGSLSGFTKKSGDDLVKSNNAKQLGSRPSITCNLNLLFEYKKILSANPNYKKFPVNTKNILRKYLTKEAHLVYDKMKAADKIAFISNCLSAGPVSKYLLPGYTFSNFTLNNKPVIRFAFFYAKKPPFYFLLSPILVTLIFILKSIRMVRRLL